LAAVRVQGLVLDGVRAMLKEFHDSIGEEGGADEAGRARGQIRRLLAALGYEEPEQPEEAAAAEEPDQAVAAAPDQAAPEDMDVEPHANGGGAGAREEEADPFGLDSLPPDAAADRATGAGRRSDALEDGEANGRADQVGSRPFCVPVAGQLEPLVTGSSAFGSGSCCPSAC
jgi:hypothetical protein